MKHAKRAMPLAILLMCALAGSASANQMYVGETAIGRMVGAGSTHDLFVDMAAGDQVVLKVVTRGAGAGAVAPGVAVTAPNGTLIANLGGQKKMKATLYASVTGTYRIRLTAAAGAGEECVVTLRGDRVREYTASSGVLDFGAVAGSTLGIRVKTRRGQAWITPPKGQQASQPVVLVMNKTGKILSARSGALAATDQYRMSFGPDGSEARVRVTSPKPRRRIEFGPAPAGPGDPSTGPAPAPAPAPPAPPAPNPAPNPAPPADQPGEDDPADDGADEESQNYLLAALLAGERDAEVEEALAALRLAGDDPVGLALDRLAAALPADPMVDRMKQALAARNMDGTAVRELGIERIGEILDAARRHERGQVRLDALNEERRGTVLADDQAFEEAANALEERRQALAALVERGLPGFLWMEQHELAGAFDAPAAAQDEQARADMQRLDEHVLAARMEERARQGDGVAIDVMSAFYRTWIAMLAGLDNDTPMANRIRAVIEEMEAIAASMNAEPIEPMHMVLKVLGIENQMDVDFAPQPADAEKTDEGLALRAAEGLPIVLQWDAGGSRGSLDVLYRADPDGDRIQLIVRAGDLADQTAVAFDPGNADGLEDMEATPDGLRLTAEVRPDGIIIVLWNLDDREGGFELRMAQP